MKVVQNYLKELSTYIKSETDLVAQFEKQNNVYTKEYIDQVKKESHARILANKTECKTKVEKRISDKIQYEKEKNIVNGVYKPDYQTLVSNVLAKVNMLGKGLTTRMLEEMLTPITEKNDFTTLETIRTFIKNMPDEVPDKDQLLKSIPHIVDKVSLLENAKLEINQIIDSDYYEKGGLSGALGVKVLNDSGVFDL